MCGGPGSLWFQVLASVIGSSIAVVAVCVAVRVCRNLWLHWYD